MILREAPRSLLTMFLMLVVAGCAATGVSQVEYYRMVPPADFTAAVAKAAREPVEGLDAPLTGQSTTEWTAAWIEGPVSSIAVKAEFDAYSRLDSDIERTEFIRLFWERRNPEVGAGYNESLQEFNRRLAVANSLFSTEKAPGWRTVFGYTLLTLGFPTVIRHGDSNGPHDATTETREATGGDRVFWQYGLRPEDLAGTSTGLARVMSLDTASWLATRSAAQSAAQFLSFRYWRGSWSLDCGRGWLVGRLDDSWAAGLGLPIGTSGGTYQGSRGGNTGVGESNSPDVVGSGGVYRSSGGGGGGGAAYLRRPSLFGARCHDVFGDARSSWLFNDVRYP